MSCRQKININGVQNRGESYISYIYIVLFSPPLLCGAFWIVHLTLILFWLICDSNLSLTPQRERRGEPEAQFSCEQPPGWSHRKHISPRWFRGKWWWSSQVTDLCKPVAATPPQEICACLWWGNFIMWGQKSGKFKLQENSGEIESMGCIFIIYIIYNISLILFKIGQTPKPSLQFASQPLPGASRHYAAGATSPII